ncbi:MAG TPA: 23S rRNA (guanosine(2251)-2'-O)-methyltransferase RlmB [Thermoanaerobacterales bacterium]|nr:23S rRNA (guanosine(2251)-2'-O)-methyltransferase RlmB [Thermoanaerobacterales bacterium]
MSFINANSKSNAIKRIVNLSKRIYREKEGLFFVEGEHTIEEGIKSDYDFAYIVCSKNYVDNNYHKVKDFMEKKKVSTYLIDNNLMQNISDVVTSRGILAVVKKKDFTIEDIANSNKSHFLLIIDGISDPGNLGTIIRTAHACNVDGIVLNKGTVDIFNPKVLRSTAGSAFHVPFTYTGNIVNTIRKLKRAGINIYVTHVNGVSYPYEINMNEPLAIVLGNETFGVQEEISNLANKLIKIPMPGKSESLNVAIASGIMMYEVVKQRLNNS